MDSQNNVDNDPILNQMNGKMTTKFYWAVTILATIGGFLFGYDTSNIGTDLGFIPFAKNLATTAPFVYGYLIAGASLGAAVGALLYPQIGEMFPTRARGSGLGTAIGFGRLGGIMGPFVLLALLNYGLLYVFVVTGIVLIIGGIAEVVLGPELKRESLEKASNDT